MLTILNMAIIKEDCNNNIMTPPLACGLGNALPGGIMSLIYKTFSLGFFFCKSVKGVFSFNHRH